MHVHIFGQHLFVVQLSNCPLLDGDRSFFVKCSEDFLQSLMTVCDAALRNSATTESTEFRVWAILHHI